jgi:hypothetical protein
MQARVRCTGCGASVGDRRPPAFELLRRSRLPRETRPALVVSKRGRAGRYSAFHMTFDFEDGRRGEHGIDLDTFGDVLPGDAGVAWFQGGRFLGFRKVAT